MSKKEPDGYAEISPEGEFTGTEQEIYIKREKPSDTYVQNVESMGYQVIPVYLSDTPPVSKEVLEWVEKFKTYIECVQRDKSLPEFLGDEPPNTSEEEYLLDILKKLNLPEQKEHENI